MNLKQAFVAENFIGLRGERSKVFLNHKEEKMRFLTIEEEIIINQHSQGLHTLDEMACWFETYDLPDKRNLISKLFFMTVQSHPTYDEIKQSAESIKKITSPSAVKLLNRNKPFEKFGSEICGLPEKELLIGFKILLLTLAKADSRRKDNELPEFCNHWWHKDLSDEEYLQALRDGRM